MARTDPSDGTECLDELQDLLIAIGRGYSPDRLSSMTYMRSRDALLQSELGALLPGFLTQCVSVARFRTFIELYDCAPEERERFIRATLAPAGRRLRSGRREERPYDFLDDGF